MEEIHTNCNGSSKKGHLGDKGGLLGLVKAEMLEDQEDVIIGEECERYFREIGKV